MPIILMTDSYKVTHWKQYPPKTEKVYSYFESRGGLFQDVVFFGLQYFLKKHLVGEVLFSSDIYQARDLFRLHFGRKDVFNEVGWFRLLEKHGGKLPVVIKAVPEGTVVPAHNVLMTIENTDPEFPWLTNYLETLLVQCWYPCTVATLSREIKKLMMGYAEKTGDPSLVNFKLHDFGFRGVSSSESAMIGGMAHLVNFMGTDTIAALIGAKDYYGCDMAGFSIPATEHSTITSWGKENEAKAYENMLDQYPTGTIACVSDSYNIYYACHNLWGTELKNKVLARGGCLIIRPDSGKPEQVLLDVLHNLEIRFGCTINDKGYKVLDPHVRIIQGDGVDILSIESILRTMSVAGWSIDNIAFGMGGALLQKLNRDTNAFAFKCSSVTIDGKQVDVWKEPITDPGKNSKRGRLMLVQTSEGLKTATAIEGSVEDKLVEVFRDGEILKEYTFEEVRNLAPINIG